MNANISQYMRAGYPVIAINSDDEAQVMHGVSDTMADFDELEVVTHDASGAMVDLRTNEEIGNGGFAVGFSWAAEQGGRLLIVFDCQHIINNAPIYRALLRAVPALKSEGSMIVLVAPHWTLPRELQHSVAVIDIDLPTREELSHSLDAVVTSTAGEVTAPTDEERAALLDAAAGLTRSEAENAFALSYIESNDDTLDHKIVQREKMRAISGTGYLTVTEPVDPDSIGGMQLFKQYITEEVVPHFRDAQLAKRGILLCGFPGTGKSLGAKAVSSYLRVPLVRFDVSACKGGLVGESEKNVRHATAVFEAVAPCVVWIDEIDKAVAGHASSSHTDGGTTLGMVGHLLTWMQEHTKEILIVATCNDYDQLPAPLTRAGRIDAQFGVALPTHDERVAIAKVHLDRLGCNGSTTAEEIANATDQCTGAEIEALVKSAACLSGRAIESKHITEARDGIRPVSQVEADKLAAFNEFAKRSLRPANAGKPKANNGKARKITK